MFYLWGGINNDYKTVFDVIDMGLGYLVNVYDTWKVEKILDDYHKPFSNTIHWQFGHVLTILNQP